MKVNGFYKWSFYQNENGCMDTCRNTVECLGYAFGRNGRCYVYVTRFIDIPGWSSYTQPEYSIKMYGGHTDMDCYRILNSYRIINNSKTL